MAVHDLLKGREYNQNKAVEGFDKVNNSRTPRTVGYADVLLRPTMVGILRCGKMLPPQLNLVIEIEFADATTALWSENAGAHLAGATLSSDLGRPGLCAGRVLQPRAPLRKVPGVQLPHGAHAAVQRPKQRGGAQRHRGARLHETHKRVCGDNDAGSKIHLLANLGQDVAPIGAPGVSDAAGQPAVPSQPTMKGASEHFHFLSVLAGTYDDTVRNIDIGRVGYLRHSFIAGFPAERVPKMPLSGVSARSGDFAQLTFKPSDASRPPTRRTGCRSCTALGLVSSACWSTVGSASCTESRTCVFSSPVAGFSMTHMSGSKCAMISRALSTSASPSSSRPGLAQTMSKCPGGNRA